VVHDLSDGGLVAAAAEMALASDVGITLSAESALPAQAWLFGEDQGRYLLGCADPGPVLTAAASAGVPARVVGAAGGVDLSCTGVFTLTLEALKAGHEGWLPGYMA
jgi:phosphoribosylformylglycinamidine synthase